MKKMLYLLSCLFAFIPFTKTDYLAAVVEYRPDQSTNSIEENMAKYYIEIENAYFDHHAEIIVFPEYGFTGIVEDPTNYALEVPDVGAQVTLIKKFQILYKIAQAAKDKLYVALNLLEKVPKSKNEIIYYNTNVVFDKNMTVVAKYRKVNLYNEPKLTPGDPNQNTSIFTTDFNVTFGMFIGYDMLSYNPSRSILENSSITDVILPTAWFSTLPFFHSMSFHSGYAMANNVNLLVATNHNFSQGIGGSGIYGSDGIALSYYISEDVDRWNGKPLFSVVKDSMTDNNCLESELPKRIKNNLENFQARRYFDSDHYTFKDLNLTHQNISEDICEGSFCCSFEIVLFSAVNTSEVYKLMVHTGQYSLGEFKRNDVRICSLLACETSDSSTCGTANVTVTSKFQSISIKTNVKDVHTKFYQPVTLTTDLLPVFNTTYHSEVNNGTRSIVFSTNGPEERVLVFGIYGNSGIREVASLTLLIATMLMYLV
ncbi:vanin-like protein 1 isoform X1 [Leptinotarsa decemlineata]|uniref:vanin-like protein 1 isoform X1 n=1 Tax=Leptinotarsa decemlineata TaxID=7539 RepID=UPI003D30C1CC